MSTVEKKELKSIKITENKQVRVMPIVKSRPFFPKGHDGEFMYSKCTKDYVLPRRNTLGRFADPFEEGSNGDPEIRDAIQEAFEVALNKPKGTMNVYDMENPYWCKEFVIKLFKEGMSLNLRNPLHALIYRVMKVEGHFAPNEASKLKNGGKYEWVLVDDQEKKETESKLAKKRENAYRLYFGINKSKVKLYNALRVMRGDNKLDADADIEFYKAEVDKVISQIEKLPGVYNIDDFINTVEDPQFNDKVFVLDAIKAKEVTMISGDFRIAESKQLIGQSLQKAVDFFSDPKHSDVKMMIMSRLKK